MDRRKSNDSDEESAFEDAEEHQTPSRPTTNDLQTSLEQMKHCIYLYHNNKFDEAFQYMEPGMDKSVYHALGATFMQLFSAMLTMERERIQKAAELVQRALSVCNKLRHKSSISETIGNLVGKNNYDSYTMEQIHAELVYAEILLVKSGLTILEDETLTAFIKTGFKLKSCYNSYKACNAILETRQWSDNYMRTHFDSGVKQGFGLFNLFISFLPKRAIKFLEFIGFSGKKEVGLQELENVFNSKDGVRHITSGMVLLLYHLYISSMFGDCNGDFMLCEKILNETLPLFPNGVWLLAFKGRLELLKCNLDEAESWYKKMVQSQNEMLSFQHVGFWELMWTNSMKLEWMKAAEYADLLVERSKWSRTIYSYQKASLLLMLGNDLPEDQKAVVDGLMKNTPEFKQRILGKSIPMEKFAIQRASRYFAQSRWLCLPGVELLYLWNFFKTLSKNPQLLRSVLNLINSTLAKLPDHREFSQDNRSLLMLLKGCCLRFLTMYLQAEECLQYVIDNAQKLKEDTFLVPYAVFELALIHMEQKNYSTASAYLNDARKKYTGYSLEMKLHFKIQSTINQLSNEYSDADVDT